MDKVSMPYLFSFSGYQTKCVIKFFCRQFMTSKTFKIYFGSSSKAMTDREKKSQRLKYKHLNANILKMKKAFSD